MGMLAADGKLTMWVLAQDELSRWSMLMQQARLKAVHKLASQHVPASGISCALQLAHTLRSSVPYFRLWVASTESHLSHASCVRTVRLADVLLYSAHTSKAIIYTLYVISLCCHCYFLNKAGILAHNLFVCSSCKTTEHRRPSYIGPRMHGIFE